VIPPFFHIFGYKCGWLADLLYGTTTIPLPKFDFDRVVEAIEAEKVSIMVGPPTIFIDLINHPRRGELDLSSLRVAVLAAANVPPTLYGEVERELGFEIALSGYGLTEATGVLTTSRPGDDPADIAHSVGRPNEDVEVIVVDEDRNPVPTGEQGEILARGFNVMSGYWEDPKGTAETIDADGWLHTGDIGAFNDRGFLQITDRKKDMVIVGGFNVYPAEVERILSGHEMIAEAAVVGVQDERFGEVTAAFVIPVAGSVLTPDDIRDWSREHMANFKAPRHVEIVEDLPRNGSMKVLKAVLRERARTLVEATLSESR
jgi:acyl-CoA synthetase (AMP-forming)/AMP-acid ligase II